MCPEKYMVVECVQCSTLTYKKVQFKTIKCPKCGKALPHTPLQLFTTAKEAINFIKTKKLANFNLERDLFERLE